MELSTLPTSPASERRIIGCLIDRGPDALLPAIERGISPADFADTFCRRIYETVLKQHAAGLPFGASEMFEQLKPTPSEASELLEITRDPAGDMMILPKLCSEARALTVRRAQMRLAYQLTVAAKDNPEQVANVIASILETQAEATKGRPWALICDEAIRAFRHYRSAMPGLVDASRLVYAR